MNYWSEAVITSSCRQLIISDHEGIIKYESVTNEGNADDKMTYVPNDRSPLQSQMMTKIR